MSETRWQACLDLLQSRGRLPSVVGGVLRGGELVWSGASGDVPGDDPADVQYRIGSITKTLVAVAVLRLRDEGLLSLDDTVGAFVPETGYADATVRSLLAHTSGMQSEPVGPWWERSPGVDVATLLRANDGSGAVAPDGDYFHYSNLGFALLGEVVARVRGAAWWEVVSDEILAPLGMTRTSYDAMAPAAQGLSVDHFTGTLTREPHQDTGAMAPAGQAWSTVADLARWAAFLAAGRPGVLSAETLREAAQPAPPATDYGLGLRLVPWHGGYLVGHTGSMPGFLASCFGDPASGDGCVVLANATTGLDTDRVPRLLLGSDQVRPAETWVPSTAVPAPVAGLPGLWFWGNSALELRWHNQTLVMHSLALQERQDVFAIRPHDQLVGIDGYHRGETLHVVRRPDGTVSHLECATFVYTRTPYDPGVETPVDLPDLAAGRVLHRRLVEQVDELKRRDGEIRRGKDEGVHRARVACRRLRAALATFRTLVDRGVTDPLRDEIRWLGLSLSDARDAKVIDGRLRGMVDAEAPERGPARERLDRTYAEHRRAAWAVVEETLSSDRYVALLDTLDQLVADPPWTAAAALPAQQVLPRLVRRDWRRLERSMARVEEEGDLDAGWHDVRKDAKRSMYAAETLEPVWGGDARRLAEATHRLTSHLGERQDTVMSRAVLLEIAARAEEAGESSVIWEALVARDEERRAELDQELPALWQKVSRQELRRWME